MFIFNWFMVPKQRIIDEEVGLTIRCTESVVTNLIAEIFTEKYQFKIPADIQNLIQKESISNLRNREINRNVAKTAIHHIIMLNLPLR